MAAGIPEIVLWLFGSRENKVILNGLNLVRYKIPFEYLNRLKWLISIRIEMVVKFDNWGLRQGGAPYLFTAIRFFIFAIIQKFSTIFNFDFYVILCDISGNYQQELTRSQGVIFGEMRALKKMLRRELINKWGFSNLILMLF